MKIYSVIFLVLLTLTGCTVIQQQPAVPIEQREYIWTQHQSELKKLTSFDASGSFSYISPETKVSARFLWKQQAPNYFTLKLLSPFGSTILTIDSTPSGAMMVDDNNKHYYGNNVQELVQNITKMSLPIEDLQNWLIGLPSKATHIDLNEAALLKYAKVTESNGAWQITINSYTNENEKIALPNKMELKQNNQTLRLSINKWNTSSGAKN